MTPHWGGHYSIHDLPVSNTPCLFRPVNDFLPASVGKAGKQRSSELLVVLVTLLLPMHAKAYKAL